MGAGKAFGYKLSHYDFEEIEFLELLKKTNSVVGGSYSLAAYIEDHLYKSFDCNDLDIFIQDQKDNKNIEIIIDYLVQKDYKLNSDSKCNDHYRSNNITKVLEYSKNDKKVQLIVLNVPFESHLQTFDLECCKAYWHNTKEKLLGHNDILKMKTTINIDHLNKNTLERCKKYIDRGFTIFYYDRNITEACKLAYHQNMEIEDFKNYLTS